MAFESALLQIGVPGGMELAVILLIAILLFGANRIPKLARSTGQALGEFQRGRQQVEEELQEMQGEVEEATPDLDDPTSTPPTEPTATTESAGADVGSETQGDTDEGK